MMDAWYETLYEHFSAYDDEPYVQNTDAGVGFIEQHLDCGRPCRILDVRCGTGRHTRALARRSYQVVGLDLSEYMVRRARSAAGWDGVPQRLVVGDARALPFDTMFDIVLILSEGSFSLVESDAMDRSILGCAAHVLKVGGLLILTAPHAPFLIAHEPEPGSFDLTTLRERFEIRLEDRKGRQKTLDATQRYYTCPELRCLLANSGLDSVRFFAVTGQGFDGEVPLSRNHFEVGAVARRSS